MNFLKSPTALVILVVAVCAAIFIYQKKAADHGWGFRDYIKHPEMSDDADKMFAEAEKAEREAQHWSDDQVARTVRHFVLEVKSGDDAWGERRIRSSLGPRIDAPAIAILKDPVVHAKLTTPTGDNHGPEAPFNRLCDLFVDRAPAEIIGLVVPYLDDSSERVRQDAALVIGKTGAPASVAPIRKALADSGYLGAGGYALMGLEYAVQGRHLDAVCQKELFGDLQQLVTAGKNTDKAAPLLLAFDPARATEFLLSPTILNAKSESLHHVLNAFEEKKISVPRDRLLTLIPELEKAKMEYPVPYALGTALHLLGRQQNPADRALLEKMTAHTKPEVAAGAASGILALHGLEGFEDKLSEKESNQGFAALSAPQRNYAAVMELDGEVNNGGHAQYFSNSSGDLWREALAGLEAMGFKERTAIFREAVQKFGKDGPSPERQTREDQLAKLARKDDKLFDALDSRYYDCKEVIDVLAMRYVIQNAEAFR